MPSLRPPSHKWSEWGLDGSSRQRRRCLVSCCAAYLSGIFRRQSQFVRVALLAFSPRKRPPSRTLEPTETLPSLTYPSARLITGMSSLPNEAYFPHDSGNLLRIPMLNPTSALPFPSGWSYEIASSLLGPSVPRLSPMSTVQSPTLSPLQLPHSPSCATSSSSPTSRFSFDHVPFEPRTSRAVPVIRSSADEPSSAFDLYTRTERYRERRLNAVKEHEMTEEPMLRKQSVIRYSSDSLSSVELSSSLPLRTLCEGLTVTAECSEADPISESSSPRNVPIFSLSPVDGEDGGDSDTEKKQCICFVCNKDFKRPDILSRHLRRHTGEKPFRCDKCSRLFSRSDHLRTHYRTHTDDKPYQCTYCNYAARRRDVLTRHIATRHTKPLLTQQKYLEQRSDGDAGTTRRIRCVTETPSTQQRRAPRQRRLTDVRENWPPVSEAVPIVSTVDEDVIDHVAQLQIQSNSL